MGADALPDEILSMIFSLVPCVRLVSVVPLVSRRWRRVSRDSDAIGRQLCVPGPANRTKSGHCLRAAKSGHINCVVYARDRGRPWGPGICAAAAAGGHLDILRYAHAHGAPVEDNAIEVAMAAGHLDCVWWLCDHGHPWGRATCASAGSVIDIAHMRRLREGGCPWGNTLLCVIASNRLMDCLHYALENGCPHHADAAIEAARAGWLDGIKYMESHGIALARHEMCDAAADGDQAAVLEYMLDQGFVWRPSLDTACAALGFQSLDVLRLVLRCANKNLSIAQSAAYSGRLDALRLVHEAGWTLGETVCNAAASAGSLACLVYASEHGCPMSSHTCICAADTDSAECLAYARERGAPWHYELFAQCVRRKARRCLVYAIEHGYPL